MIDVRFIHIVPPSEQVEHNREHPKHGSEHDGVESLAQSPGPAGDPHVEETGHGDQKVAGEVLKVQLVSLRGVESAPVDQGYQNYR